MMFRLMHRLKKKHGAVLFAVIAVMALLIAMSTAAYYTARGSYNSVVSSYSYSQLYLSAISAADMVTAAVMNDKIPASSDANNKFDAIQAAVNSQLNPVMGSDGSFSAPTNVIYLKSDNLNSITVDATTTAADVVTALGSADPITPGVLDGLTIEISAPQIAGTPSITPGTTYTESGNKNIYTDSFVVPLMYRVETTAYYNGDTITVEDIFINDKKGTRNREVDTQTVTVPGGGSTTYTGGSPNMATGSVMNADGSIGQTGRNVLVSVKRLDGNMTFHNDITYIGTSANNVGNKIDGSLNSDGSLYFSKCNVNVSGTDNHWYVGGDFVTTNDQAGDIKLNQNKLYVGGDMIIANQREIQAKEIFVNGDLYVLKHSKITTDKLHVSGNIYFTEYDSDGNLRTTALEKSLDKGITAATDNVNSRLDGSFELELGGSVIAAGKNAPHEETQWWPVQQTVTVQSEITAGQNVKIGDNYSNVKDGSGAAQIDGAESFSSTTALEGGYTVLERDDTKDKYVPVQKEGSLLDAIEENANKTRKEKTDAEGKILEGQYTFNSGGQVSSPQYTAKPTTYQNKLTLDFSSTDIQEITQDNGDGTTTVIGYYKDCPVTDASGSTIATARIKINGSEMQNAQDITVNIPYVEDGFVLSYANTDFMGSDIAGNATVKYNIVSDPDSITDTTLQVDGGNGTGKTMPVVLAANTSDGNGFSWKGDDHGSNDGGAYVSIPDNMKVTFEMGNYDTTDGTYKPYKAENSANLNIPTYIFGTKIAVGSESIINKMKDEGKFNVKKSDGDGSLTIGNISLSDSDIPESNVMIVSNSSKIAYQADFDQTLVAGCLYAPSGQINASNNVNGAVINIGSVVISDYTANHADYHVVLPKPSTMDAFVGPLSDAKDVTNNGSHTERQEISGSTTYTNAGNYAFGEWSIVGSDYLG